MEERDWDNTTDPEQMLEFVGCEHGRRQCRLFAVHYCRVVAGYCQRRLEWEGARWLPGLLILLDRYAERGAVSPRKLDATQRLLAFLRANRHQREDQTREAQEENNRAEHDLEQAESNHDAAAEPNASVSAFARAERALERAREHATRAEDAFRQAQQRQARARGVWLFVHIANRALQGQILEGMQDAIRARREWFGQAPDADRRTLCVILREIFGNPFRPIAFDPVWRTSDVMALANGIYAERAFDRMPILADALQDAGCDSDDILNHLRDVHATHVRGCWALDLVLGKE